jgi:glycosyltransferase involved in cell wall biosynthesis
VPPADLTVVVPTRDRPALLRRAVDSALAQAGASVEVVVVDDGSAEPVQLPGDPRLRVVRHEASRGGSAARNTGTTEGTGRFVTYLDDDDTLLPHLAVTSLQAHAEAVEHHSLPAPIGVLTGMEVVDAAGTVLETRLPVTSPRGRDFWLEDPQPGASFHTKQTLVVERDVLLGLGGWDEAFRSRVHTELFLRLNRACSLLGVPEVTYRLLEHGGDRVSKNPQLRQDSFSQLVDKHAQAFAAHPVRAAEVHVDHAVQSWIDGRRAAALRHAGAGLRRAPMPALRKGVGRVRHELRQR